MIQYLNLLNKIVREGTIKPTRTGIETLSLSGFMFEHDMRNGFPLLTTKKMSLTNVAKELEFFIKGYTDKYWLIEQGCSIWNEWCNPQLIPDELTDAQRVEFQFIEGDLGPIYGFLWRYWGAEYINGKSLSEKNPKPVGKEGIDWIDQLANALDKLRSNPLDRRNIVSAWNPQYVHQQALPSCHYGFQFLSDGEFLDLLWNQRSIDTPLGLPYNIASYALLLDLAAKEADLIPRRLVGFLADCHIYKNQMEGILTQVERTPRKLPKVVYQNFNGVLNFRWQDVEVVGYNPHPKISMPVAV